MFIEGSIVATGAGSAARLCASIPFGTVDTSDLSVTTGTGAGANLGPARWFDAGSQHKTGCTFLEDSGKLNFVMDTGTDVLAGNAIASGDTINYRAIIPITNWWA